MGTNMNTDEKDRTVYHLIVLLFGFSTLGFFHLTFYWP